MLRVTYEIVPFGQEDHPNKRIIAVQKIGLQDNVDGIGHYVSALHDDAQYPPNNKVVAVTNDRSTGAFELVRKTLEKHCGPSLPDGGSIPAGYEITRHEQSERGGSSSS